MKRKDLIRRLEKAGFKLLRNGADHDIYARGSEHESVPRHTEIKETTAMKIIKRRGL